MEALITSATRDELNRIARRVLKQCPEYRNAREEGYATEWLRDEAESLTYKLTDAIYDRVTDLNT